MIYYHSIIFCTDRIINESWQRELRRVGRVKTKLSIVIDDSFPIHWLETKVPPPWFVTDLTTFSFSLTLFPFTHFVNSNCRFVCF
jgi:hypothetical protein